MSHPPALTFRVAARTNTGRCRDRNEDAFSIAAPGAGAVHGPPAPHASLTAAAVLCGVFDGCGGSQSGAVPSGVAARVIEASLPLAWASLSPSDLVSQLLFAVQTAARRLFEQPAGMGTTATLAAAAGDHLHLVHIGDSRAYLLRDGRLAQLSMDHTLVSELLLTGRLKPEEAADFPHKNVLLRVLGTSANVKVDAHLLEVRPGDKVLLCSDGVSGMVDDPRISALLQAATGPEMGCNALIDAAEQAGGHDNETAVILFAEAET